MSEWSVVVWGSASQTCRVLVSSPVRIQRQRTLGWRMPEGAVYVGRPSPWGNPFPVDGDTQPWLALAVGERADRSGRIRSAVKAFRWWMTEGEPQDLFPARRPGPGDLEFSSGRSVHIADVPVSMGLMMLVKDGPFQLGPTERPSLAPLRDATALACWCPLVDAEGRPVPCHADVLIELLADGVHNVDGVP